MCLYAGYDVLVTELVDYVFNVELGSTTEFCALLQAVQFLCLTAVDADADNFIVEVLL